MSDTSTDLGVKNFRAELPEGWVINGGTCMSKGVVENSFGQKFEYVQLGYIHESSTAEVFIHPDRTTMLKGRPAIILEMKLRLMIEDFKDVRLFDNFRKAKDWAVFFMERYHKSKLYDYDTSQTNYNSSGENKE